MSQYIIGVDQGTTGTFVGLMGQDGNFLSHDYKTHRQIQPHQNWVEHDPIELWHVIVELVNSVVDSSGVSHRQIAGFALANQGESVVMWDAQTSNPIYNVIVWQDSRTQDAVVHLANDDNTRRLIQQKTGLLPDSYFSASKIRWLLDNVPDANNLLKQGRLRCGTLDTWFIWKLTNGKSYVTDPSTASRTLLYNIHTHDWDDDLLRLFDIPRDLMADILDTTDDFGIVAHPDVTCKNIPIVASLVDQPSAMIGHGCLQTGGIKATYGTGCFINMNTSTTPIKSPDQLLTLLAWTRNGVPTYGLDGGVLTAGACINWLKEKLHLFDSPSDIDQLCKAVQHNKVLWIPAQIGLGTPYWDRAIRGAFLGLDLESKPENLIYAVLEGIALRVAQIVKLMQSNTPNRVDVLRVDGGLTNIDTLMQLQADLLGFSVEVLASSEATTLGACYLGARYVGMWDTDDTITSQIKIKKTFEPSISDDERSRRIERFDNAIQRITGWV